jgi:radical SAM protein with 4Fe4S-binding SPASM domain
VKTRFRDVQNFFRKTSLKKVFNFLKIRTCYGISILSKKPVIWGYPYSIAFEPTSYCNLHCKECPTGTQQLTRKSGNMDFDTFKAVIDQLYPFLFFTNFSFQGEPFMNPLLPDLIRYASQKKIYTGTSTNGHFLNSVNSDLIIRSGLDRIIISMDGTDQETYSAYRNGGDLQTVINGIKNLVEAKKTLNSDKPYIILQFLVLKTNEHQIPMIKQMAKELGADKLQLKSAQFYDLSNKNILLPEKSRFARYYKTSDNKLMLKKSLSNKCYKMWNSFVVTWDGEVVPCCFDKNADYRLGNISKETVKNIWKNKLYSEFRNKLLKSRKSIVICQNCSE